MSPIDSAKRSDQPRQVLVRLTIPHVEQVGVARLECLAMWCERRRGSAANDDHAFRFDPAPLDDVGTGILRSRQHCTSSPDRRLHVQSVVETLARTALLVDVQVDQIEDGEHEWNGRGRRSVESEAVEKARAAFAEDPGQPEGLRGVKERQTAFEPLERR